jgi:hypothetical protein
MFSAGDGHRAEQGERGGSEAQAADQQALGPHLLHEKASGECGEKEGHCAAGQDETRRRVAPAERLPHLRDRRAEDGHHVAVHEKVHENERHEAGLAAFALDLHCWNTYTLREEEGQRR